MFIGIFKRSKKGEYDIKMILEIISCVLIFSLIVVRDTCSQLVYSYWLNSVCIIVIMFAIYSLEIKKEDKK